MVKTEIFRHPAVRLIALLLSAFCFSPSAFPQATFVPTKVSQLKGDVTITSPSSGQTFTYNGTKWVNSSASTVRTNLGIDTDDAVTFGSVTLTNGAGSVQLTTSALSSGAVNIYGDTNAVTISSGTSSLGIDNAGQIFANDKIISLGGSLTFGTAFSTSAHTFTTNSVTYTLPGATSTLARTDAAQTFAGIQNFSGTTSASSATTGTVTIGNGTAATNVGIGGGNIQLGGNLTAVTTGTGLAGHGGGTLTFASGAVNITGSVSLGSHAPTKVLDITASAAANTLVNVKNTSTTGWSAFTCRNSTETLNFGFGVANSSASTYADQAYVVASTAHPIVFGTTNLERMRLHASGGLSIGNTTDPGATNLSVTGSVSIGGGTAIASVRSASASVDFASTADGATNTQTMTVTSAATTNTPGVTLGGALPAGWDLVNAYVSGADTVTIIARNRTGGVSDPAAVTLRAVVVGF